MATQLLQHKERPPWLQPGTLKVGTNVPVFNLPAGHVAEGGTCPGATTWCAGTIGAKKWDGKCYAHHRRRHGWNKRRVVRESRERNLRHLLEPGGLDRFVTDALEELKDWKTDACRLHVSGDFFSPDYTRAWLRIVRGFREMRFWTYTHSWRVGVLRPHLEVLQREPNMQLFASLDPHTGFGAPPDWRVSTIHGLDVEAFVCPLSKEVINRRKGKTPRLLALNKRMPESCYACGFCIDLPKGVLRDVGFVPTEA